MTEVETEDRRAGLLRKIRGLLDTADSYESTGNSEAAQTYRNKADAMVAAYAVEEFELAQKDPRKAKYKPEKRDYDYGQFPSEIREALVGLFGALAAHCGVRLGRYWYTSAIMVGYPEDMDYLDLLFTSIRLHMSANIRPQPTRDDGYDLALAKCKESGMKWVETYPIMLRLFPERFVDSIANVRRNKHHREIKSRSWNLQMSWEDYENQLVDNGKAIRVGDAVYVKDVNDARGIGVRFTKEYTTFCQETERVRIDVDPKVWVRSFVDGYAMEVRDRLYEMKRAREEATSGHEIVLKSMKDELNELLFELFPDKRPHPKDCQCDVCHICSDPKCKRVNCVARRKPVRYRAYKEPVTSSLARQRGRAAGANADLSGGRNTVGSDRKEIN